MTSKKLDQIRKGKANISNVMLDELNAEGFPDFMVNAFLQTAETTNTIISSRLPGGAGVDLMEANYDLKGFQIKAKSCDWGPMAGFICQLPFLNKAGYSKINYNVKYFIDYLTRLNAFNTGDDAKKARKMRLIIDAVQAKLEQSESSSMKDLLAIKGEDAASKDKRADKLVEMLNLGALIENGRQSGGPMNGIDITNLIIYYSKDNVKDVYSKQFEKKFQTGDDKDKAVLLIEKNFGTLDKYGLAAYRTFFAIKNRILAVYNKKLGTMVAEQRVAEAAPNKKRAWSGNNDMPTEGPSPFIELKRVFTGSTTDVIKELKQSKYRTGPNFKQEIINGQACIKGIAFNAGTIEKSSVKIEFLLKKEKSPAVDLWAIYYGKISYRKLKASNNNEIVFEEFNFDSLAKEPNDASIIINNNDNKAELKKLGITPKEDATQADKETFYNELFDHIGLILTNNNSPALEAESVEGGKAKYYPMCGLMNPYPPYEAKSPDFHKNAVSGDFDLFAFWPARVLPDVHMAQLRISEIKMGQELKLFMNMNKTFGLEFIPSFEEIAEGGLKESAELGNISGLGFSVSVKLNIMAAANYAALYKNTVAKKTNRAFHSDEGGRPAVMEVEFPIAIFFPKNIRTRALNNEGINSVPVSSRPYIDTKGGLIKNSEEFLQLIVDINFSLQSRNELDAYKVMLHSEWLIHLFYVSLLKGAEGQEIVSDKHEQFLKDEGIDVAGKSKDKLDEFKKILENHVNELNDNNRTFDSENYNKNLKTILRGVLRGLEKPEDNPIILPPNDKKLDEEFEKEFNKVFDNVFERLRTRFIELAFEDSKAAVRKASVKDIWPGTQVVPFVAG